MQNLKFNVALLSSGLGHIKRGIETWTDDLGAVLSEHGISVTVYKGGGRRENPYERVIPCLKRTNALSKSIIKNRPGFLWRFGLATGYTLEQLTFNWMILPVLIIKQFDIIHTQDPQIADFLRKFSKIGILKSKIILAHGTEEPFAFLGKFDCLQHLAPFHKEETESHGFFGKHWFAIGNFIDKTIYSPGVTTNLRKELNIPEKAFVVLSVAAIKRTHKRIDYLIQEMASFKDENVYLLVAGSKGAESQELIDMGKKMMGDRAIFLSDFPHERIYEVYAIADIFALCSLKDMMPIALLEALSSGLPALVHKYPVEEWMIGAGGESMDMSIKGELSSTVKKYQDIIYRQDKSEKARQHAVSNFATKVVLKQIIDMYEEVLHD